MLEMMARLELKDRPQLTPFVHEYPEMIRVIHHQSLALLSTFQA